MNQDTRILRPQGPLKRMPMTRMPQVPRLFARLLALSLVRPGDIGGGTSLDNVAVTFQNLIADKKRLDGFKALCGYDPRMKTLPAPFIQTLFIGMVSRLISSAHFPITPMGLIQVGQSFELKAPLDPDTPLDLSCRILDMTGTDRGIRTRVLMEAGPSAGQEDICWQGIATYFTRARHPGPKGKKTREDIPLPVRKTLEVSEDTGRRYAAVSGDYNPHHLYGWTARLIGFKRPIAHGMWSLSRACASLEKAFGHPATPRVEAEFKLPIFLPSAVTLGYDAIDGGASFEIREAGAGRPHLKGRFRF